MQAATDAPTLTDDPAASPKLPTVSPISTTPLNPAAGSTPSFGAAPASTPPTGSAPATPPPVSPASPTASPVQPIGGNTAGVNPNLPNGGANNGPNLAPPSLPTVQPISGATAPSTAPSTAPTTVPSDGPITTDTGFSPLPASGPTALPGNTTLPTQPVATNSTGGAAFTAPDNTTAAQVPVGTAGSTNYPVVDSNGTQIGMVAYPGPYSNVNAIRAFQSGPNGGAADATTAASPQFQAAQAAALQADTPYYDNPVNAPAPAPMTARTNGGTVEGTVVTLPNGQQAKVVNGQLIAGAPADGQPLYQADGSKIGTTGQSPASYTGVPAGLPGSIGSALATASGSSPSTATRTDQTPVQKNPLDIPNLFATDGGDPLAPSPGVPAGVGSATDTSGSQVSPSSSLSAALAQAASGNTPASPASNNGVGTVGTPASNANAPVTTTPTDPTNPLTSQTLSVGALNDPFKMAQDQWSNFQTATEPQYSASLRDALRTAAAGGALGSGQLNTSLGDLTNNRNIQLDTERATLLNDALKTQNSNAYANLSQADQQQAFQKNQQDTGFNDNLATTQEQSALNSTAFAQALSQLTAGEANNPAQMQLTLSQLFGNNAAAASAALGALTKASATNSSTAGSTSALQSALQQYINSLSGKGGSAPAGGTTSTPAPQPYYNPNDPTNDPDDPTSWTGGISSNG